MVPPFLHRLALFSLWLAAGCSTLIAGDILLGRKQKMAVMNVVWPLTGLYFGPFAMWAYFTFGRAAAKQPSGSERQQDERGPAHGNRRQPAHAGSKGGERAHQQSPSWKQTFVGTSHCGAGCTLGDFLAEWGVFLLGWTIAGLAFWPELIADFCLAFLIGIAFQYLAIAPMRHLSLKDGLIAAVKADTLSITAFEVGMFVWMALTRFVFFPRGLHPTEPTYWFMMQIAMVVGFATSYPMNHWLIARGLKEAM